MKNNQRVLLRVLVLPTDSTQLEGPSEAFKGNLPGGDWSHHQGETHWKHKAANVSGSAAGTVKLVEFFSFFCLCEPLARLTG